MAILIDIPKELEQDLRAEWGDLERAAKEALLIESYRSGKLSIGYLAEILGMGVIEAENWLGQRGVNWNYSTEDLEADRKTLSRLLDKKP